MGTGWRLANEYRAKGGGGGVSGVQYHSICQLQTLQISMTFLL